MSTDIETRRDDIRARYLRPTGERPAMYGHQVL
jgi:hypothetical protein